MRIAVGLVTAPWRHVALYQSAWARLPAAFLFALGVWLYWKSDANFGTKKLGGIPELHPGHPEQRLVTTGIHAHLRHPVHLAHLCEMVAWSMGTGMFEEVVYRVGQAKARIRIGGRTLRASHWTNSYHPFTRKQMQLVKYAPYPPSPGSADLAETQSAF